MIVMFFNLMRKVSKWFLERPIEYGPDLVNKWLESQDQKAMTVVSTETPWGLISDSTSLQPNHLILNPSLEVNSLHDTADEVKTEWIVGIGSGRVMDVTKYLAFYLKKNRNRKIKVCLIPSILSTTAWANFGIAVRKDNKLYMPGNRTSDLTIVDPLFINQAPERLNTGGIADLVASASAMSDWKLAHDTNGEKISKKALPAYRDFINRCIQDQRLLHPFNQDSVKYIYETFMDALGLCGASMSGRPMEGAEHFLYYAIDELDDRLWNHGQIIAFTTLTCLHLHKESGWAFYNSDRLKKYFDNLKIKYSMADLGLMRQEMGIILANMRDFVIKNGYYFTIWNSLDFSNNGDMLESILDWMECL